MNAAKKEAKLVRESNLWTFSLYMLLGLKHIQHTWFGQGAMLWCISMHPTCLPVKC